MNGANDGVAYPGFVWSCAVAYGSRAGICGDRRLIRIPFREYILFTERFRFYAVIWQLRPSDSAL